MSAATPETCAKLAAPNSACRKVRSDTERFVGVGMFPSTAPSARFRRTFFLPHPLLSITAIDPSHAPPCLISWPQTCRSFLRDRGSCFAPHGGDTRFATVGAKHVLPPSGATGRNFVFFGDTSTRYETWWRSVELCFERSVERPSGQSSLRRTIRRAITI